MSFNFVDRSAFFTAAFSLALQAYTGSESAVFTTVYDGRKDPRTSRSVSMFIKTLPVILDFAPGQRVQDAVEATGSWLANAAAHDIFSFAEIHDAWGIGSDVLFAYQGEADGQPVIGNGPAEKIEIPVSHAVAPFSVFAGLAGDQIECRAEWNPGLYSRYTMDGFINTMNSIVIGLTEKETIGEIALVSEADRQAILALHDTSFAVEARPAYRLLQNSAEKYPEKTALVAIDRTLTYRELNGEANAVGHILREYGEGPDTIVAVMADRDSYAYVMREGVLKSGGAFMLIDPEYPEERIRFILEDSGAKLMIATDKVIERRKDFIRALLAEGITVLDAVEAVSAGDRDNLNVEVPYESLAYVIYTSGSTGKPKGVMLTNKNLVNFVDANEKNREILGYTERGHVSLAIAALTFDFAIMEEYVPIAHRRDGAVCSPAGGNAFGLYGIPCVQFPYGGYGGRAGSHEALRHPRGKGNGRGVCGQAEGRTGG